MAGLAAKAPGLGSKIWKAVTSNPAKIGLGGFISAETTAGLTTKATPGTAWYHTLNPYSDKLTNQEKGLYAVNAGLGALGTKLVRNKDTQNLGFKTFLGIPSKDLVFSGTKLVNKAIDEGINGNATSSETNSTQIGLSEDAKKWLIGGGVGLAALAGIGGLAGYKFLKNQSSPSVRVKLPGVERETEINIPIRDVAISRSLQRDIGRDVRRTVREDNKSRRTKIDPVTRKRIPVAEYELKYGDTSVSPSQGGSVAESAAIRKVAASIRKLIHQPF